MPNYGRSNLDMTRRLAFLQGGGNQPRKLSTEEQVGSVLQSLLEKVFNPAMAGIEKRRAGEREEQKLRTGRAGEMSKSLISGVASGNLEPSGDVSLPDLISSYEKTGRLPSEVTPGIPPPGGIGPRLEDVPLTFSPKAKKVDYRAQTRKPTSEEAKVTGLNPDTEYRNDTIDSMTKYASQQGRQTFQTEEAKRKEGIKETERKRQEGVKATETAKKTESKRIATMKQKHIDGLVRQLSKKGSTINEKAAIQEARKQTLENEEGILYGVKRVPAFWKGRKSEDFEIIEVGTTGSIAEQQVETQAPTFQTEAEALEAAERGEIKKGDKVVINGQEVEYY